MMISPNTRRCIGELPPFWDRNVIFFSNLQSIFYENAEEAKHLLEGISGATGYGGRVLCIIDLLFAKRPNLVVLEARPDQGLIHYLSHDLGLSLPDFVVLGHDGYREVASLVKSSKNGKAKETLKGLKKHKAGWIDGFVTDSSLAHIARLLGKRTISTLEGSKNGN
ncbi:MAG: hypothetical protein GTO40_06325, partial [Deltaproteobacteria bacterium]|nr:hypothetical protein [Deltaproteobacteria bacterium]